MLFGIGLTALTIGLIRASGWSDQFEILLFSSATIGVAVSTIILLVSRDNDVLKNRVIGVVGYSIALIMLSNIFAPKRIGDEISILILAPLNLLALPIGYWMARLAHLLFKKTMRFA